MELQKCIDLGIEAKGIRLDVYVDDGNNTVYDIEMQTKLDANLPKRSRYYQGLIDLELLDKGMDYTELKKSYVIFICTSDPFGKNAPIYTFENRCVQTPELPLGDETNKIFLNASGVKENIKQELKEFLQYIHTGTPTNEFTDGIEKAVQKVKRDEKWRQTYMVYKLKLDEARNEGHKAGMELGHAKTLVEDVEKVMRTLNVSFEEACRILVYSVEEYEAAKRLIEESKQEKQSSMCD